MAVGSPQEEPLRSRVSPPRSRLGLGVRHVQMCLMTLCSFMAYALRSIFSVAVVVMVRRDPTQTALATNTQPMTDETGSMVFEWDESVRGALLSAFFWGYMLSQIPGGLLAHRLGGSRTLAGALFTTGMSTLLLPLCASLGSWQAVFANRVLQGLTQGPVYPSIYTAIGLWAPKQERDLFSTVILGGQLLGPSVSSFLCGFMAANWGWPSIFYGFGAAAAVSGAMLWALGADRPSEHARISPKELAYIQSSIEHAKAEVKRSAATPWAAVMSSPPVWALWVCSAELAGVFFTFLTNIPNYFAGVLKFDVQENGIYSSLPFIVCLVVAFVSTTVGGTLRNRNLLSTTAIRKISNGITGVVCSLSMILMSYTESRIVCITLMCVLMGSIGTTFTGTQVNFLDLSPNFSGPIFSVGNLAAAFLGVIGPQAVGFIVSDPTSLEQWKIVFWGESCITLAVTVLYLVFASGDVQPWNDPNYHHSKNQRNRSVQNVELEDCGPMATQQLIDYTKHIDGKDLKSNTSKVILSKYENESC